VGSSVKVLLSVPLALLSLFPFCSGVVAWAQEEPRPAEAMPGAAPAQPESKGEATTPAGTASAAEEAGDQSRIVYVSDFDLDLPRDKDERNAPVSAEVGGTVASAPAQPRAGSAAPGDRATRLGGATPAGSSGVSATAAGAAQQEAPREEGAAERVRRFVDFVSNTLVKELQKEGYVARRLRPEDTRPEEGIRISGVFAEPDEQNRLRRAVLGGELTVSQMAVFVSIGNLARPEQALYAIVDPKTAAANVGPVITVSAYAPVARFEMSKNVTEKAVRDMATSIVADLTQLLHSNVAALMH
jgi:Domain of unknown function (DUF4410)